MPSILADQHPDCWGALDFVDLHMEPITKTLTVVAIGMDKPPGGGAKRVWFMFEGDRRKMFLKKSSRVFICNQLRTMESNEIKGAELKITAVMARNPKGNPPEVLSMTVVGARFPSGKRQQAQEQLTPPEEIRVEPMPDEPTPERGDAYE